MEAGNSNTLKTSRGRGGDSFHKVMLNVVSQEHTKVGSADSQDIQLCGMGIQAEHCVIDITPDAAVVLTPYRNAR